ncbi:MAG TPA: MFS transporter [Steroidobacteraceae bacterium]|nr:MFS transporter [Steroidobacteraceae bacterium]
MARIRAISAAVLWRRSMLIALIVACAFFMESLDATIIVTAVPAIGQSFGTAATRVSLAITAYVLATAACIPASGWLADRVGARDLFASAIGLFTAASMVCGVAPTFSAFIAARIVQGSAAAMMSPVGRLVVLRNTEKRDLMQALSTLVWPALFAPVLGPPLGGLITSALSWRWIFYVNVPLGIAGIALVLAFIPNQRAVERTAFDGRGFALMGVTLASLAYGVDLVGASGSDIPLGLGLIAAALATGFLAVRHLGSTRDPLVRLASLRVPTFFAGAVSGGTLSRAAISATPFLLPLMFQVGFGVSPVVSGLLLLIYMAANLSMKALTNPILRRFGMRSVLIVNGALASACIAACALISPSLPRALSGLILALAGASRSMQFTAISFVSFADIAPEERASASVLSSLTQQISMGMGVAVGALMLNFSRLLRHGAGLGLHDFRLALVLAGAMSALALPAYARLAPDAGAELSGHRPA